MALEFSHLGYLTKFSSMHCVFSSSSQDVHETAAGALWNLAFNPGNALRIVEEGGVPALVDLCSSSVSKMARFMAALALAYMFDGRYVHKLILKLNIPMFNLTLYGF